MVQTILFAMGIILLMGAAITIFVVYGRMAARKKKKQLSDLYNHVVFNHSLDITTKDAFANRLIAMDEAKKMLLYIDNSQGGKVHLIKLKDVAHCNVVSPGAGQNRKNGGGGISEDHSKDLSISLVLKNRSAVDLEIYNEMQDGPQHRPQLMKLAKAWQARIASLSERSMRGVMSN